MTDFLSILRFIARENTWEYNGETYKGIWHSNNSKLIHLLSLRINALIRERCKMNYHMVIIKTDSKTYVITH